MVVMATAVYIYILILVYSVNLVFNIVLTRFSKFCLLSNSNVQIEVFLIFTAYIYMQVFRIYILWHVAPISTQAVHNSFLFCFTFYFFYLPFICTIQTLQFIYITRHFTHYIDIFLVGFVLINLQF